MRESTVVHEGSLRSSEPMTEGPTSVRPDTLGSEVDERFKCCQ